ncbi:MAG: DNA cytosine methyltransferase [Gammaproteobacteria bacterium]|nr:DNA cytosine methyltransferase [Gammaproteobacteria bacterium]
MKDSRAYKSISLFSGAGGMDIGIHAAGFDILSQIEIDEHCCDTLRTANCKEKFLTEVIEADIRGIDAVQLRKKHGLRKKELDLIFGGPPCQSFSLAGKQRGLSDDRGLLIFEVIRFAEEFQPKVILLEQVKGLLSAKGSNCKRGEVFRIFLSQLEAIGYTPKWRVLVAADYGVPQLRERLFVVATRERNGFMFPERTHAAPDENSGLFPCQPYVGVGEVIADLGPPSLKNKGTTFHHRGDSHVDVTPLRDRERIAQVPEGSYLAAQTHLSKDILRGLQPKDTTKYLRLHRTRPSNTLRCGEIFYHPTEDRYLTPREYMRIHGYPDSYILKGPIRSRTGTVKNLDQHRQVANSVPPPVAEALGSQITIYIREHFS